MSKESKEIYEFGPFRLDVGEHQLKRTDDVATHSLPEKAFQTLCVLVQNSGHLMSKQELLDLIWPDAFVEENNLDKSVHAIRNALGEKATGQKYIETVRKHGYRFVADVRRVDPHGAVRSRAAAAENLALPLPKSRLTASGQHALVDLHDWQSLAEQLEGLSGTTVRANGKNEPNRSEATDPAGGDGTIAGDPNHDVVSLSGVVRAKARVEGPVPDEGGSQNDLSLRAALSPEARLQPLGSGIPRLFSGKRLLISVSAVVLLVVIVIGLSYYFSAKPAGGVGKRSIAVLPFKPIDSTDRNEDYELGIADSLINQLGAAKGLIVRPLHATRKYADIQQDPVAAGKEQKADYVLAANYQLADSKIRVTAELYNVATGQIEETYKSEKDAGNIFAMQDAIAGVLANGLLTTFALNKTNTAAKRGTNNEDAYRLYLQGRNLTMKRNKEDHRKAIECFEQAIKLDPNFALAYARMAHAYSSSGYGEDIFARIGKIKEIINKAFELDPNLAEAYVSRGQLNIMYEWDFPAAEKDFLRAIELEPNNAGAHWLYALLLANHGRFDEAFAEIEAAQAIDPGAALYMIHRGRILYYARRYDEAIGQYKQVIDLDERFSQPYYWLLRAYETTGDYDRAFEFFIKSEEKRGRMDADRLESYQRAYKTAGWTGVWAKFRESTGRPVFFDIARLHALKGEKDAAFEHLNKSIEKREWLISTVNVEPALENLRGDPRFEELLRRVGFNTFQTALAAEQ